MNNRSKFVSSAVLAGLGLLGVSGVALADQPKWAKGRGHYEGRYERGYDYARVVDVDPIIRRVRVATPQRECWEETYPVHRGPSRTEVRSTIVGGLIGAAAGHHFSMRHDVPGPAAVIGGSMIGAAIGNNIGVNRAERNGDYRQVEYRSVERCEVRHRDAWAEEIQGYRVTYVYEGRRYTTRMPYDPGRRVRVDVNVRPVFERY